MRDFVTFLAPEAPGGSPHERGITRAAMAIRSEIDQFFLALAASHCFWVSSLNPWPLHEFWPLQELLADLQADCPLQTLTPVHWTLASSAEAELMGATLNSSAAAAAMAAP
jgi:hypothetical protein